MPVNQQILLDSRPVGEAVASNFKLVSSEVPSLQDGQVLVRHHLDIWPEILKELGMLVAAGKLRPRESVAQGLEAAPEAFLGLLKGKNFGKQLVKLI